MSVITEGNVSGQILSFTPRDFLYTGAVCKSWRQNSREKRTNILRALDSVSMLKDAIAAGMDCSDLLDLAIVFGAGMGVVSSIASTRQCDTSMVLHYAAFTGNMEILAFLGEPFDEFCLFEAVRGGQLGVVQHILKESCGSCVDGLPQWPCTFYDDDDFIDRCISMAAASSREDVAASLRHYVGESYYHANITCLELAIRMNQLGMVHLLYEGGATVPSYAFAIAVETSGLDMLRYLKSEKCKPDHDFLIDYISSESFSVDTVALLLENGLVELSAHDLQQAIHTNSSRTMDLLLQFGCPVDNETIDHAVSTWNFELARGLMASHGCRPTAQAYEWLFTGALCTCCVEGFYPNGADDFYIRKLDWIYSATNGETGFESISEMEDDPSWAFLLPRVSRAVVQWFNDHCNMSKKKKQRCS